MAKQYLTTHTIDDFSPNDVFSFAVVSKYIFAGSGSADLRVYDASRSDYPLMQTLENAHKLGCHHLAASTEVEKVVSVGFEGEVKIWEGKAAAATADTVVWNETAVIKAGKGADEIWAAAVSSDGKYLAGTSVGGQIGIWDIQAEAKQKIREFETKGSFGMSIDLSLDGRFTASGHEDGGIYLFNNETGRMAHALSGLIQSVRALKFSPGGKLLAAAGDARVIALYDVASGEQVALLTGHVGWIFSLDWNSTGEYVLSGSFEGKAKVWSVDMRECVATISESDKTLWAVKWLPRKGRNESFAIGGAGISLYREATGG